METPRDIDPIEYARATMADASLSTQHHLAAAHILATNAVAEEIAALGALLEDLEDKRQATLQKILAGIDQLNKPIDPEDLIV
jgi:hypothetical protein